MSFKFSGFDDLAWKTTRYFSITQDSQEYLQTFERQL